MRKVRPCQSLGLEVPLSRRANMAGKPQAGKKPVGAPEPRIQQLRELVERASGDNPHLTSRLERAAFLMVLRPIEILAKDRYRVGSEDGLRFYEIVNGHCQCSDYLRHGSGHPCKHRLALALYQRLEGLNLVESAGTPKI